MAFALTALAAILLDWVLGEPRRWHPLVGFGGLVNTLEDKFYGDRSISPWSRKMRGVIAVILLVLPFTWAAELVTSLPYIGIPAGILLLYLAIGHKSLHDHARPVARALQDGNLEAARQQVSRIVSRDPATLKITTATIESVLENGSDSIFATLFWFAVAGVPGAVLHRLVNTLDAMWGYRNQRYTDFGWAAARLDDLMNFVPARLTAMTYALLAIDFSALRSIAGLKMALLKPRQAISCWNRQAPAWDSPNAGPVMAAGAGALEIKLGGPAHYGGEWHQRAILGVGPEPNAVDIDRALNLVRNGVIMWLIVFIVIALMTRSEVVLLT